MQAKDLIVLGSSRLLGKLYCGDIDIGGTASFGGKITTNQLVVSSQADVAIATNSSSAPLVVGNVSGVHLAFDGNEIMAKNTATTVGTLYLNNEGGEVQLSGSSIKANGTTFTAPTGNITNITSTGTSTFGTATITNAIVNSTLKANKIEAVNVDVADELRAAKYSIETVQNLGGHFLVCPTLEFPSDTSNIASPLAFKIWAKKNSDTQLQLIFQDQQLKKSGGGAVTYEGTQWNQYSHVKVVATINNTAIPTCNGYIASWNSDSGQFTLNITVSTDIASKFPTTSTEYTSSAENITVMLYKLCSNPTASENARIFYPIGIFLTAYGKNKFSSIDIYNGYNEKPVTRMGKLDGLPAVNGVDPVGWGFYSAKGSDSNHPGGGYFDGYLVAKNGLIGGFSIGEYTLKNGTPGSNGSVFMTTNFTDTAVSIGGSSSALNNWRFGAGSKFGVTSDGTLYCSNVNVTGIVNATTGTFGNANTKISLGTGTTGNSAIWSGMTTLASTSNGMYVGTDGIALGGGKFKVTTAGALTAKSGYIANWGIFDTYLQYGTIGSNNSLLACPNGTGSSYTIANKSQTGWTLTIGNHFGVDNTGGLYCNTANITGSITASSLTIQSGATTIENFSEGYCKLFKNVASYSGGSSVTGYIAITTPILPSRMCNIHITGYNYSSATVGRVIDLNIGFYVYSDYKIYNATIDNKGDFDFGGARVATVSSSDHRVIIILGTSSTILNCPKIIVDSALITYTETPDSYASGWSITSLGTTLPSTYYGTLVCTEYNASKTATNCITEISNAGIWVTPSGKKPNSNGEPIVNETTGTTGTKIDGIGVGIWNNGVNVAQYGSSARVGSETSGHVNIASTGMDIYGSNGNVTLAHFGYEPTNGVPTDQGTPVSNNPYYTIGRRYDFTFTPDYSTTKVYSIGDIVKYENEHYVCIKDMDAAESWTRSHWLELFSTKIGSHSIVEGYDNVATAQSDHAEGRRTVAQGAYSHAEGYCTIAGSESVNTALGAHSEGIDTMALSSATHAEGMSTIASGFGSHAEGEKTEATGIHAHSQNNGTIARYSQTAIGEYNVAQGSNYGRSSEDFAFIIGNGVSNSARSNALTVNWKGDVNARAFYDGTVSNNSITLALGTYISAGLLTNAGRELVFSIPTGRVFPNGTTVYSISFDIVVRIASTDPSASSGSGAYYIVKKTSGGTDTTSFNSTTNSSFYDGNNTSRTLASGNWVKTLQGGTNILIDLYNSTSNFFTGNATVLNRVNNMPCAVYLLNISVVLDLPTT